MNKFIYAITFMFFALLTHAQVGINTDSPNAATVLDIVSSDRGILIPRLTTSQRDTYLANNPALEAGTIFYNLDANRIEYWEGTGWKQVFVATNSTAGNDGVVKINGYRELPSSNLTTNQPTPTKLPKVVGFGNNNRFGAPKQVFLEKAINQLN